MAKSKLSFAGFIIDCYKNKRLINEKLLNLLWDGGGKSKFLNKNLWRAFLDNQVIKLIIKKAYII